MSDSTPDDFSPESGWDDDRGVELCPVCERTLGAETGYHGEVFDQDGNRYEFFLDTDPAEMPFFCADCWADLEANQRASEHKQLTEWSE